MTDNVQIPKVESRRASDASPAWWFLRFEGDAPFAVIVRCHGGHDATLRRLGGGGEGHAIADDGTVTPSIVCPHEGCDWHVFGALEDWVPT